MRRFPYIAILLSALAAPASAKQLTREEVPKPLAPWVDWVLAGKEESQCPSLLGGASGPLCAWPGPLTLELNEKGGSFRQSWRLYADAWAALPGEAKRWPQSVLVDGKQALVVERGGIPQVHLPRGTRSVSGSFQWDSLPEMLSVPDETGVVTLSVRGKGVPFPVRDVQGRVWLQKSQEEAAETSRLEVSVHRKVTDEIPLELFTAVTLKVSGKSREVLLGKPLPAGFTPTALEGPLPARLERDGRLRVQVRPGTWNISLVARHEGPAEAIALGQPEGDWDADEVWVFEARNQLRLVSVEGPASIDPQQTELNAGWRGFPAYLMRPGDSMKLVERRRGDADPEPDRLSLSRTLWLDFDGGGWSAQDSVSGQLNRSWRLEMAPRTSLGRVAAYGQDQFLTALSTGGAAGIEVRQKDVNLVADSRIEGKASKLPAVSWNHDFDAVSATLHLPPGWQLLHAWGVDQASPTWVARWNLLDFFLVLVIAFAVGRLWGKNWGIVALAASVLAWHEPMAPKWIWLFVLAAEALARALPEGGVRKAATAARGLGWLGLVLIILPFSIVQVRQTLYPQLEARGHQSSILRSLRHLENAAMYSIAGSAASMDGGGGGMAYPASPALAEPMESGAAYDSQVAGEFETEQAEMAMQQAREQSERARLNELGAKRGAFRPSPKSSPYMARAAQHYAPDPSAIVNTGPGLPSWNWHTVSLTWQGPVKKEQVVRLWLLSPACRFILTLLRLTLVILLMLLVFNLAVAEGLNALRAPGGLRKAVTAWFVWALLFAPSVQAQEFPPQPMLDDLQRRLLETAPCQPNCADSPRLRIEVAGSTLRARFEVNAAAETAVPLPGGDKQWLPQRVLVDGAPAQGLRRSGDGRLWLSLSKGAHTVQLEGALPDRETVQVPLPLKSRRVEASASGWVVDGVHEDGLADDTIQLTRIQTSKDGKASLEPGQLPPFVLVQRTLVLGLSWEMHTVVSRMTPLGSPIVLEVPLVEGESVMTENLRLNKGKAVVNMGPQARSVAWSSRLEPAARITLTAPKSVSWVERWTLDAGPIWHADPEGIPTVFGDQGGSRRLRQWRPWPGESVSVDLTRPSGVPGQSLTIDRAALSLSPGLRATDASLEMSMRSSRGAQHTITLPEGADLQSVRIDGGVQPIRQEGRKVTLPIQPGAHSVGLDWRQEGGIGLFFRTPVVDLGSPSVNAALTLNMPERRWTLFLGGPRLGPAVLFWSLLAVFFLASLGLGKIPLTPLRWPQWFLLSVGLTQVPIPAAVFIAAWLMALGARRDGAPKHEVAFNLVQVALGFWTVAALACLFTSITQGLLGMPDMQISGNGSYASNLMWYQDRSDAVLPRAWTISVPLWVYRVAMLAWALWLASSLLNWLKWGWQCFGTGGLWRKPSPAPMPDAPKP